MDLKTKTDLNTHKGYLYLFWKSWIAVLCPYWEVNPRRQIKCKQYKVRKTRAHREEKSLPWSQTIWHVSDSAGASRECLDCTPALVNLCSSQHRGHVPLLTSWVRISSVFWLLFFSIRAVFVFVSRQWAHSHTSHVGNLFCSWDINWQSIKIHWMLWMKYWSYKVNP